MIYLNILLISTIILIIFDNTDFIEEGIEKNLNRFFFPHLSNKIIIPKCSLCISVWVNILYVLLIGLFNLPTLLYILIVSVFGLDIINQLINYTKDIITIILKKLYEEIKKKIN